MSLFQCWRGSDLAKLEMIAAMEYPPDGTGLNFNCKALTIGFDPFLLADASLILRRSLAVINFSAAQCPCVLRIALGYVGSSRKLSGCALTLLQCAQLANRHDGMPKSARSQVREVHTFGHGKWL